jgi:extradiol dioxygenase family protein
MAGIQGAGRQARVFRRDVLGCRMDRSSESWGPDLEATLFIRDPYGNALEFKGFRSIEQVFAHRAAGGL